MAVVCQTAFPLLQVVTDQVLLFFSISIHLLLSLVVWKVRQGAKVRFPFTPLLYYGIPFNQILPSPGVPVSSDALTKHPNKKPYKEEGVVLDYRFQAMIVGKVKAGI